MESLTRFNAESQAFRSDRGGLPWPVAKSARWFPCLQPAPPPFPIHLPPAFLPGDRLESSFPIPPQPQPPPRVIAPSLRVHRKKVLAQKQVFVAIPIQVAHTHSIGRRQLRFQRQF